jgi:hypothetical protein
MRRQHWKNKLVSSRLKVSPKASHQASKERGKIRGAVLVAMFIGPRAPLLD